MRIVFEDEKILVLEKPAGLSTTSEGVGATNSVQSWIGKSFAWSKNLSRNGICHRLDKGTSGLLLIAKDEVTCTVVKSMFKDRKVKKTYLAMVGGRVPVAGLVEAPIGRSPFFAKRKVVIDGKDALTYFEILRRYVDVENKHFTLLLLRPKTGRTHQIRVHCSYMGWPLVGDGLYGGDTRYISRQFLHANSLSFNLDGKSYQLESELPLDLEAVLKKYVEAK